MLKKLLALLAALAALTLTFSACAQETLPAAVSGMTLEAFKTRYAAVMTGLVPGTQITWQETAVGGETGLAAVINGSFTGGVVISRDDQVRRVMVLYEGSAPMDFLALCSYMGAALLPEGSANVQADASACMTALSSALSLTLNGTAPDTILGLPGGFAIARTEEGLFRCSLALELAAD